MGFQLFYHQVLAVTSGDAGHSGSYDFFTRVDAETLTGWPGLEALLHVKGQYDRNVNQHVGGLVDPIDDADFDSPIYVDELWLQQALFDDRLRLRAGFLEQQTVFDRNAFANSEDLQFLSSFLDNNALVPLPNALGAVLIAVPVPWLELAAGVADGNNRPRRAGWSTAFDGVDGLTAHFELLARTRLPGAGDAPRRGAVRLGAFRDGRNGRNRWGAYLSLDQVLWRAAGAERRQLGVFARAGWSDPDVSLVEWFWSLGLEAAGPLPARPADVLGLGTYQSRGARRGEETGFELYYRVAVLPWLAVTPDLQLILDPGARGRDDAVVGALRFRVSF